MHAGKGYSGCRAKKMAHCTQIFDSGSSPPMSDNPRMELHEWLQSELEAVTVHLVVITKFAPCEWALLIPAGAHNTQPHPDSHQIVIR